MPRDGYLLYERSIEQPRADEAETIKTIVASIERTSRSSSAALRQQHAKSHGFLRGELIVYDLPDHLRQGIFATPRTYPIIVRLSTAFGEIRSDRVRRPRGMAIKVLGVSGPKALTDDKSSNQDFLLVNHKSYFSDAAAYLNAQRIFEVQPIFPDFAIRALGFVSRIMVKLKSTGVPIPMLANALADPGANIIGETFYSEGALRFGDYVARLAATPVSDAARGLTGQPAYHDDDELLHSVVDFFSKNSAEYELRAQLCVDLQRTPDRGFLDRLARRHCAIPALGENRAAVSSSLQPGAPGLCRRRSILQSLAMPGGSSAARLHHAPAQGRIWRVRRFPA